MLRKDFIKNALAVCGVSLTMSILGMCFRTYASNRVGPEVMGLLQLVLSVYYPACTLASSGIYVASTRLCAEVMAKKDRDVNKVLINCFLYGLLFGVGAFLLLFFGAEFAANTLLNFPQAELPLRILSFGLPFLSVSNGLQGFFLSLRKASYSTVLQVTEDLSKIGATILLFSLFANKGPLAALNALAAGMAVGEILSCMVGYVLCKIKVRDYRLSNETNQQKIFSEVVRIALPCAFSGYLRSGIGMVENLLVPRGLEGSGLTPEQTLSALGKLEGMALPVLVFPATFLTVVSKLLVPEITAENAVGHRESTKNTAVTVLRWTAGYGIFIGVFALLFGKELGMAIYGDKTCGIYISLLAPLVPILYSDRVTDGIMKGYNQQLTTMKINLFEAIFQALGAWLIIPLTGIPGYIALFAIGTAANFALSFRCLKKTGSISFPRKDGVLRPVLAALAAILPMKVIASFCRISPFFFLGAAIPTYIFFYKFRYKKKPKIKSNPSRQG